MPTVTYVGPDQYSGVDNETGVPVQLGRGDSADVSEAKAEQLLADFPDWFAEGEVQVKDEPEEAEPAPEPEGQSLDSMTKSELLEHAKSLGLDVSDSNTKAEIRAAIEGG